MGTPSQPPQPRRPGRSPHGPGRASRPSAAPHLRVRTVGLYLPLFLFLKSEFMVAVGRGGGRCAGLGTGLRRPRRAPRGGQRAQVSGRRRGSPECGAAAAAGHYSRGAGRPQAPAPHAAPEKVALTFPGEGRRVGGASRRALSPAGASWAPGLEPGWGHGVLGGPGPPHPLVWTLEKLGRRVEASWLLSRARSEAPLAPDSRPGARAPG